MNLFKLLLQYLRKKEVAALQKELTDLDQPSNLRFTFSWFSNQYVTPQFFYKGRWRDLKCIDKPMLWYKYDAEIKPIAYRLYNSSEFRNEKQRWNTIRKCLDHNEKLKGELIRINKDYARQRQEQIDKREQALKNINK